MIRFFNFFSRTLEVFQLRHFDYDVVKRWLPAVVPTQHSSCGHKMWYPQRPGYPPVGWIEEVWKYLGKHFPDLHEFEHLPLVQVEVSSEAVILAQLQSPSTLVVRALNDLVLDDLIVSVLRTVGVTIIEELPEFISSHPACFKYVHQPTVSGVLKALLAVLKNGTVPIHLNLQGSSKEEKCALRKFLSQLPSLDQNAKELLRMLPIFETLEGSGGYSSHFVAPVDVPSAAPEETLPVRPPVCLIDVTDEESKRLAQLLEVKLLRTTEYLQTIVFPDLEDGKYAADEVDQLMLHVLQRVPQYHTEDATFIDCLKLLAFVRRKSGCTRARASELFDPNSQTVQNIFLEEDDRFPSQCYQDVTVIGMLQTLGLMKENDITASDILSSTKLISQLEDLDRARIKSEAIFQYLNRKPQILQDCVISGTSLLDELLEVQWVTRTTERPDYYPEGLSLYQADTRFERARDIICNTKKPVSLVGTIKPAVQGVPSPELAQLLGWDRGPPLEDVIINLRNVVSSFVPEEKASFMSIITEIYQYLSRSDPSVVQDALKKFGIETWVWNGDGFSSPSEVIIHKTFTDLSPYVYSLPKEMNQFSKLFRNLGIRSNQDPQLLVHVLHLMREKHNSLNHEERIAVKHDLQLSIDILNELEHDENGLPEEMQEQVLIPTDVEDDSTLRLAPIKECTYCDTDWRKQGHDVSEVEDDDITLQYVHRNLPQNTAESLGVPTLRSRILDPDQLRLGEEFGQSEPLTTRLNRLLEDYTDGFAVPKELIQNADDAGATEVRLLYDERDNEDARTCLIDDGMREWQGPALWAYNDATFSDADFENITKLNGGTKKMDSEKIGRFGLGFNVVYNLTDVPSFISRNNLIIFDPHTTHLGRTIRDKSNPGLKFDVTKPKFRRTLKGFQSQFKPYNGIFGCDLSPESNSLFFDGTLFRFPMRNRSQAARSEIKNLPYDDAKMKELLQTLVHGSESLLLFTQNVIKVTVYHLPREAQDASQPAELFQVVKKPIEILRRLDVPLQLSTPAMKLPGEEQAFVQQCNFLKASTKVLKQNKEEASRSRFMPESSMAVEMVSSLRDAGHKFFPEGTRMEATRAKPWLVFSCVGSDKLLQQASKDESLPPTAGVATRLEASGDKFFISPIADDTGQPQGSVFCYLPLPVHSGLPVHINGGFAVRSNRRHLMEKTEDDKQQTGGDWNKALLEDAVCKAYVALLGECGKFLSLDVDTVDSYYKLWPTAVGINSNVTALLQSFYESVLVSPCLPQLFTDGEKWTDIKHVTFMDPELRKDPRIGEIAFQVLRHCKAKGTVVIDLPEEIVNSIRKYSTTRKVLEQAEITKSRFFKEVFFPNIKDLETSLRDPFTLYALDEDNRELDNLIRRVPCIPVSPNGENLKCPWELVNPSKLAKILYEPKDKRFPYGSDSTFLTCRRLTRLCQLRMVDVEKIGLSWNDVVERATSVEDLSYKSKHRALKRIKTLFDLMKRNLEDEELEDSLPHQEKLLQVRFLPVMSKPQTFPLKWKKDELDHRELALAAAQDVYPKKCMYKVCCTQLILDESNQTGCGPIPPQVKVFLKIQDKRIRLDVVFQQMQSATTTESDLSDSATKEEISKVCKAVYDHLQEGKKNHEEAVKQIVSQDKPFVFVKDHFVETKQVAFKFPQDCAPFLYQLPEEFTKFKELMNIAGVRELFTQHDFVRTLKKLKTQNCDRPLDERNLTIAVTLAKQLERRILQSKKEENYVQVQETIYLPSSADVLLPAKDLCIKDCHWMPGEEGIAYVHRDIPPACATNLGVKTRRQETLHKFCEAIPFGQKEKLTNRLKRLLTVYPFRKEILKELLQNADDAQATKICFIKDPRQHPDERVFEDSWKPLQGPALCVYNNKPFTNADLSGIQSLGEGSKGDDPNKTGQYGVGFNAVYHLTDVPTFMSKGTEIGEVLCVFDPHRKFAPVSTTEEPGMMINVARRLRNTFTDVFPCYLEDLGFPIDDSTMFRFPLRSPEMAEESSISTKPVLLAHIDELMVQFKSELFEVMLFVNNVEEISLCEVDPVSGKLCNTYTVKAAITDEGAKKREELSSYIKQAGMLLQKKELTIADVKVKEVSYTLNLSDSEGKSEKWFVIQRIGFEQRTVVPEIITEAFRKGDLALLPRGGVAACMESSFLKRSGRSKDVSFQLGSGKTPGPGGTTAATYAKLALAETKTTDMKAFCFLPLPDDTNLPVHINGHFALDHEGRRGLLKAETSGKKWNDLVLQSVVAPSYASLLSQVKDLLGLAVDIENKTKMQCKRSVACSLIQKHQKLFPPTNLPGPYWDEMAKEVYRYVNRNKIRLLPVVRDCEVGQPRKRGAKEEQVEITWFPPSGERDNQAFFNDLRSDFPSTKSVAPYLIPNMWQSKDNEDKKISDLKYLLLRLNFNLIEAPLSLCDKFNQSFVDTKRSSPLSVTKFFQTYLSSEPLCRVGKLPAKLEETPFEKVSNFILLLKYCMKYELFTKELERVPLLLTQDGTLRVFETSVPTFLTTHVDILPECASEFVHRELLNNIFHNVNPEKVPVFKAFGIQDFAERLPQTLSIEYRTVDCLAWNPADQNPPSKMWIHHVWQFVTSETSEILGDNTLSDNFKRRKLQDAVRPLNEWCLIPVTETIPTSSGTDVAKHYLVPIGRAKTVLGFWDGNVMTLKIRETLRKFGLPELDNVIAGDERKTALRLVATLDNPSAVLVSLHEGLDRIKNMIAENVVTKEDCKNILIYFNMRSVMSVMSDESVESLRRLPFHLTVRGDLVQIRDAKASVLPLAMPTDDMHVWEKAGTVFLRSVDSLQDLYKFLQCLCLGEVDVYCHFIFQHFGDMSPEARINHLKFVKQKVMSSYAKFVDRSKLVNSLRNLPFLPTKTGMLSRACDFYDPNNPVFRVMFANQEEERFPSPPFNESEWLPFLRLIGLVQEVTLQQFVIFAEDVAKEAITSRDHDVTQKKSKALLQHLFGRSRVATEGILPRIRDIAFIYPIAIGSSLQKLCSPYGVSSSNLRPFVKFNASILNNHLQLAWSCVSVLPSDANPRENLRPGLHEDYGYFSSDKAYVTAVIQELGILEEPTPEIVVSHCENICYCHTAQKAPNRKNGQMFQELSAVMEGIYAFLQQHLQSTELNRLKNTACVLMGRDGPFVLPNQLVLELLAHDEIKPFLYKFPADFGRYQSLFLHLGAARNATADQYATVLHKIYEGVKESESKKLDPNEILKSYQAVKGLFETIKDPSSLSVSTLFLPAKKIMENQELTSLENRERTSPAFMMKSTDILFDDAPNFRGRIGNIDRFVLVDLSTCELKATSFNELVMKLPAALRPGMLTEIVNENLVEKSKNSVVQLGPAASLKMLLISNQFAQGVVRLIRHEDNKAGTKTGESKLATVAQKFHDIQVYGVHHLATHLIYNGEVIPCSEKEKPCFAEKVQDSGTEVWKIYIQASMETLPKPLLSRVAEVVDEMTNGYLRNSLVHLPILLDLPASEIQSFLDELGILEDRSVEVSQLPTLPEPGTFIHVEDHHLLVNSFEDFEPGEYVGYELEDPSLEDEDGTPTYIYAIIIEMVSDGTEGGSQVTKKYKINVGNDREPIVKEAVDLYKFHRVKGAPCKEMEIYRGAAQAESPAPRTSKTLEQVKEEVSDILEEAWRLPEGKRKKIVRRLFLAWHPDKNPGREDFCKQVFQHIQNEITRLERGEPRGKGSPGKSRKKTSDKSPHGYSSFFTRWNTRASTHRDQRDHCSSSSYGSSTGSYKGYHRPNPQPGEAKRWFRQAEVDLAAATKEPGGKKAAHEWVCFKCHQVSCGFQENYFPFH